MIKKELLENITLINGDSLEELKKLPSDSVYCCVTSPPYFGLRDYGVNGQIGLEKTLDEYIDKLVNVFQEVGRVLKTDGSLWLNLGDSYCNRSDKNSSGDSQKYVYNGKSVQRRAITPAGLKRKDLIGVPWRVAFALQADGWYLRQDIIWHKPHCMPESVTDRCTKNHEYIFLLTRSPSYFFDNNAIQEKASQSSIERAKRGRSADHKMTNGAPGQNSHSFHQAQGADSTRQASEYKNKRSVWSINPKPYSGAHFAVFPPKLIEPCILAGCPEGETVLDPFSGSGTSGLVALQNRRKYIGIELNKEYVELSKKRLSDIQVKLF